MPTRPITGPLTRSPSGGVTGVGGGHYGPTWSYNLRSTSFSRTKAAIAGGSVTIAAVGDSTVAGVGATNVATKSWPARIPEFLSMSADGSGIVVPYKDSGNDPRYTAFSTWVDLGRTMYLRRGGTSPLTFTSTNTGTIVRVYFGHNSGPFTVSIDGGAAVAPTRTGAETLGVYEVTGLANTTHTITIIGSTNTAFVFGCYVGSGSGARIINGGIGGMVSSEVGDSAFYARVIPASAAMGADLVCIMCMVNDTGGGTSAATQKVNLQSAITRAKGLGVDVLLITGVAWGTQDLTAYTAVHYQLAAENGIPLLDMQKRWSPSYAVNNANGLMADTIHPNDTGYGQIAASVAQMIAF